MRSINERAGKKIKTGTSVNTQTSNYDVHIYSCCACISTNVRLPVEGFMLGRGGEALTGIPDKPVFYMYIYSPAPYRPRPTGAHKKKIKSPTSTRMYRLWRRLTRSGILFRPDQQNEWWWWGEGRGWLGPYWHRGVVLNLFLERWYIILYLTFYKIFADTFYIPVPLRLYLHFLINVL